MTCSRNSSMWPCGPCFRSAHAPSTAADQSGYQGPGQFAGAQSPIYCAPMKWHKKGWFGFTPFLPNPRRNAASRRAMPRGSVCCLPLSVQLFYAFLRLRANARPTKLSPIKARVPGSGILLAAAKLMLSYVKCWLITLTRNSSMPLNRLPKE